MKNFFKKKTPKFIFYFFLIFTIAAVVFNKIIFFYRGDEFILGLNSYRATHWLFSYQEFGFIKRGLVGSFFEIFKYKIYNSYYQIFIFSFLVFLLLVFFLIRFLIKNIFFFKKEKNILYLIIAFISSPAFIPFFASDLGRFDQINFLFFFIILIYLLKVNNFFRLIMISSISFISILIHEAYLLFQFPLIFLFFVFNNEFLNRFSLKNIFYFSLFLFINLLGIYIVWRYGYLDFNKHQDIIYEIIKENKFNFHEGVLDTFNFRPLNNIFLPAKSFFDFSGRLSPIKLIIIYSLILFVNFYYIYTFTSQILSYCSNKLKIKFALFFLSSLMPLLTGFFLIPFIDHYRIFSGVVILSTISIIVFIKKNKLPVNKFKIKNLNIILILLYNSFINIFLSPLEKGAIFISEIVYRIFNI
jgi:hypothetical protein